MFSKSQVNSQDGYIYMSADSGKYIKAKQKITMYSFKMIITLTLLALVISSSNINAISPALAYLL